MVDGQPCLLSLESDHHASRVTAVVIRPCTLRRLYGTASTLLAPSHDFASNYHGNNGKRRCKDSHCDYLYVQSSNCSLSWCTLTVTCYVADVESLHLPEISKLGFPGTPYERIFYKIFIVKVTAIKVSHDTCSCNVCSCLKSKSCSCSKSWYMLM